MSLLEEFSIGFVHWSLGITVLVGLAASQYSGISAILGLPIVAISVVISALCGLAVKSTAANYKKRKFYDFLDFVKIWMEILETLTAVATCARVASASVDYISHGRIREWFLGLESHSLGEPWPDILGVSIVVVVTGLFMLGLEKSPSFSIMLLITLSISFVFFISVGSLHAVIKLSKWWEDVKTNSVQSTLTAASLSSYGFVNTLPPINRHRALKITIMTLIPMILYSSTILVFTLMSHYRELTGTATPLLRIFEIRDVDWARLVMAVCIICIVCLALTEILPTLFGLFVTLASKKWNIFLTSLQYRNSLTGAPMLAIFAAGSLAAILAFACPLIYLIKILNTSTLLKCIMRSLQVLYYQYKPDLTNISYLPNPVTGSQYSKLKQSKRKDPQLPLTSTSFKNKVVSLLPWNKNISPSNLLTVSNGRLKTKDVGGTSQGSEYLLLHDYCDKSVDIISNGDESTDETDDKESDVLSSDLEEDSLSSTDVDVVVQEYIDKMQVVTTNNFNESKRPTCITAIIVAICFVVIVTAAILLSQFVIWKRLDLSLPCSIALLSSLILILVMPKNSVTLEGQVLPKSITPICAITSVAFNVILISMIIEDVWPGFVFWFSAGCLLFWRCDCCTCEGLLASHKNTPNITENIAEHSSDKYLDTNSVIR